MKCRLALTAMLLAWSPDALALDTSLDVSHYAHMAWRVRDGVLPDSVGAIAQTRDGYLWLGTQFGLMRFDGVRFVSWQPPANRQLPSSYIRSLHGASDGTLWIGTQLGLASWKDGQLTVYQELADKAVSVLLEDRQGTVWTGTRDPPPGTLCAHRGNRFECSGERGEFGDRASSVYEDRGGDLWVGSQAGLWRWQPGPPKLYPLPDIESSQAVVEMDDGALLVLMRRAVNQLKGEQVGPAAPPLGGMTLQPSRVLRDRDGGLWIGTFDRGLVHVHRGVVDLFSQSDGLSGNYIRQLFEDREGNVWVGTDNGLDRFRDVGIVTISVNDGLSQATPWSLLPARDGSVWVGTPNGLNRVRGGDITIYRRRSAPSRRRAAEATGSGERTRLFSPREMTDAGLPDDLIQSLFEDNRGRVWVSTRSGMAYFENDRFTPVRGIPGGVHAIAGDTVGNIWISEDESLLHVVGNRVVERIPWTTLGRNTPAVPMLPDPVGGGLWLATRPGSGVAYFRGGRIVASYGAAEGLGRGVVVGFHRDRDGTLWIATESGLSRMKSGRIHTLTAKNGLPCDGVNWVIQDDAGAFWLYTSCGLARVDRSEMDAWAAAVEKDGQTRQRVHSTVFDNADGVRIHAFPGGFTPQVGKAPDGRIWFLPWDGISVIDPRRLVINRIPPPVVIEQITADRRIYDVASGLRLPPLVREISIDYTALSLGAPEKTRFRYKLDGQDADWKEVVNERRVQYSNLAPGPYRFRVTASNNSGVWNEVGAALDFSIAPAYYQTIWFQALVVGGCLALLWAAHQFRLRRIAHEFDLRLEERVNERTRVARELHDTLLQTFHGVLFRCQAANNMLPERPAEAKRNFESVIDRAAQAITEGRDAIQDLRASTVVTNDLAVAISTLGDELAAGAANGNGTVVHVAEQGTPRDLHPILRDDIYRIAGEALRNAFRHAHARRIEVVIAYDDRQFRLQVRDDGKGIDPAVLADERRGHFGLPGMRERAELVGGHLDVWSEVGVGTELDLTIPAVKAYAAARARRARWFAKKTGTDS